MEDQNRQFREIFENSPVGIIFFDKEGNLVDVNPSALKVLRVSQLEDVKGINLFVNPYVESRKEELFKNGIIKLQYSSDLDTAKDYGFYTPTESGIIYVDYTVSITDSGFIGQIQDITEHKQVENELQESENTLRSFFDATGDMRGIVDVVADNDVRHIEDNVVTAGFLGLKPEQMRNKLGSELGEPEEILCRWIGHYEESRITGLPVTFEYQDIRENNKSHLAVTVNYLGLNSQGQPRFAYVVRDITEQKKAEEELKKSEEKFSKAFHGNPAAMILQDAGDGRILDVNESFMKLTGCSRDELIGHTTAELNLIDTEKRKQNLTEYQDEGSVKDTEFELQTKSGEKYIVTGYSEAIEHEGESRAITFFYDITKRKKAEKALYESKSQFQTLIHNLNSGVALVDESGRFAVVNPSFLRMFNLDNGMDILNVNSQDWSRWEVSGEDGKLLHVDEHPVRKVAITGKPVNNQLVSVRNPGTNRLTWMLTSAEPILDKDGSINMIICTYYDITERKKLEEKLRESHDNLEQKVQERTVEIEEAYNLVKENEFKLKDAIKELERSNKELQSFAYITSHDLQEPLRTMGNYAGLLKHRYGGQLDSDADDFLDFMASGAARLQDMIQGLLEYSRVGTQGGVFKDFNAEESLDTALTNLKSPIEECHVEVISDSLPVIHGDKIQISRVFQNLIGNALKFRKKDVQPKIHIKARNEGYEYVFSVQDNGIGIEPEYSDRIFEVFKRLHPIGEYEGTGIGLAIVKRIVERHHGRIWVESEYGVGSTFYFKLPIVNE